jgi:hypothetical protein
VIAAIESVAGVGLRTVMAATPEMLGSTVEVAVMVDEPAETPVTTPEVLTVATAVLLEAQVTVRATPALASTLATN